MKALELADKKGKWTSSDCMDAAAELRRLAAVESDCAQYLKEGETPAERIKRALGDADSLMSIYRDVVAERDALKEQMREVAMLLLDNDRSGIKAWAAGLVLGESDGQWSVRTVVADQRNEIDALKAELEGRYQSIIEMGNMLTEIVNLIRGEPEEGTSHSTHDAVELVRGLAMHNDLYATAVELELAKLKAELEDAKQAAKTWENEAERRSDRYTKCAAELERIKALEPTYWQVTQGTRSFVMTAAEFNRATFDYGSFVALYALGSKTDE